MRATRQAAQHTPSRRTGRRACEYLPFAHHHGVGADDGGHACVVFTGPRPAPPAPRRRLCARPASCTPGRIGQEVGLRPSTSTRARRPHAGVFDGCLRRATRWPWRRCRGGGHGRFSRRCAAAGLRLFVFRRVAAKAQRRKRCTPRARRFARSAQTWPTQARQPDPIERNLPILPATSHRIVSRETIEKRDAAIRTRVRDMLRTHKPSSSSSIIIAISQ